MIPNPAHSLDYKGFTIYYTSGQYYVGGWPKKRYDRLDQAKAFIDRLEEGGENFQPTKTRPA